MNEDLLTIKALKYPDIPHYEWEAKILQKTSDYVLVRCEPGRQLIHHDTFIINNTSLEYYSFKEWFTAAMEIEKGKIVSRYCNVGQRTRLY